MDSCLSEAGGAADRKAAVASNRAKYLVVEVESTSSQPYAFGRRLRQRHCELLQRIDRQSVEQLRVEVGGFLRQDFSGERDVAHLFHANRVHQERDLRFSTAHFVDRFGSFANVVDVLLVADRFFGNLQTAFQQAFVQLHHIQVLLLDREIAKKLESQWPSEYVADRRDLSSQPAGPYLSR